MLEIAEIVDRDARNRWIMWDEIGRATLKIGIIDHSRHLRLGDGRRVKFLWLKSDDGFGLLEETLGPTLGDRFRAIRTPIG